MKKKPTGFGFGIILPGLKKTIMIMKLSAFFIFIGALQVLATDSYSQNTRLSLNMEDVTIEEVLNSIEAQSEFYFLLNQKLIDTDRKVNVQAENERISKILETLFSGTNVDFLLADRQIILSTNDLLKGQSLVQDEQRREVSGTVRDTEGNPLPGVNIRIKGTGIGTTSDIKGFYTIAVPSSESVLQFSFIGMRTVEIEVADRTSIDLVMEEDAIGIDEVIAIGYGRTRKMDLTGAVSVVNDDDINYKATANAAQALQGKVAGVMVTNSGAPGSAPVIKVRGLGSVRSDTEPLYVVDGVLTDDVSFLSTNDIESITVLKDASASAIYGVRAANGVIIVTTKRGHSEQMSVSYNGYAGYQVPVDVMEMADAMEYITLLNEKGEIASAKTGGNFNPYDIANYPYSTDWFSEILNERAFTTNHDIGFSGGNENTLFAAGVNYFQQEGLMLYDLYERVNVRTAIDSKIKDFLKIGFNFNLSNVNSNNSPNVAHDAYTAPPAVAMIDEVSGNYMALTEFGSYTNPMVLLVYNNDKTNSFRLLGSGYAEMFLFKGLSFRSMYGVDGAYSRNRWYIPPYELEGGTPGQEIGKLSRTISYTMNWHWDNTLTYDTEIGENSKLKVMAGVSAQELNGLWLNAERLDVPYYDSDNTLYLNLGTLTSQTNDDWGSHIAAFSYFGRANYSLKDRYLVTATIRRDGSSIFPAHNRFDIFPSVGLGWVISNESFMASQSTFQFLKLRASWGQMGNNKIPELTAVSTVDYGAWNSTEFGGTIKQGASSTYVGPANLLWEMTEEYDLALEGSVLKSRLSFELDFYNKKTIGAIFPVTVNSALGASNASYLDNNADVRNRGVELSLSWKNNIGSLNYRVHALAALNDNEVVNLRPGTIGIYGGYMNVNASTYTTMGHSIGEFYGRNVLGVFQNPGEILAYVDSTDNPIQPNAQPGDFMYEDINQDGVINDKDRTFLGSALPTYNFAFSCFLEYRGLDFQIDLYGQGGNYIYNAKRFHQIGNENYDQDFYDNRWHGEGTSNTYPSADIASHDNKVVNSWAVEKGDFFRIQNVQIGYSIPSKVVSRIGVSNIRIFANATNPKTFFSYSGFSPEIAKTGPESATSQGVDSYVYPMHATYNLGLNIKF